MELIEGHKVEEAKLDPEGLPTEAAPAPIESVRPLMETLAMQNQIHKDFRLLLTSMPCDYFPITILQNGVKLTNEPPKGIKANLLKSFKDFDQDILDRCDKNPEAWKKMLFSLSLFHSVVLERRKFGALGWNILYDFNESDLHTSIEMLNIMLNDSDDVPFFALRYLIAVINYGGRVTDNWDGRTLETVLDVFLNENALSKENYLFAGSDDFRQVEFDTVEDYLAVRTKNI